MGHAFCHSISRPRDGPARDTDAASAAARNYAPQSARLLSPRDDRFVRCQIVGAARFQLHRDEMKKLILSELGPCLRSCKFNQGVGGRYINVSCSIKIGEFCKRSELSNCGGQSII
jgi:hypothetical protein